MAIALWSPRGTHRPRLPHIPEAVESVNATPKNKTTHNAPSHRFRAHPRTVAVTRACDTSTPKRLPSPIRLSNRHRGRPNHAGRRARLPPPARIQHPAARGPAASACRGSWRFRPCRVQWCHQKHKYHTGRHRKAGFASKVCWCPRFTYSPRTPATGDHRRGCTTVS